jgi:hypothetical protein
MPFTSLFKKISSLSVLEMGGTCSTYGEGEKCINILVGIGEGKEATWKIQSTMEDVTEMVLHKIGWGEGRTRLILLRI